VSNFFVTRVLTSQQISIDKIIFNICDQQSQCPPLVRICAKRELPTDFLFHKVSILPPIYLKLIQKVRLSKRSNFQHSLFLLITTLLSWLTSTFLLKSSCFGTTIYMKTQCLQTNEMQHYWNGKCLRSEVWSRKSSVN
jgi:hypothetical protein